MNSCRRALGESTPPAVVGAFDARNEDLLSLVGAFGAKR